MCVSVNEEYRLKNKRKKRIRVRYPYIYKNTHPYTQTIYKKKSGPIALEIAVIIITIIIRKVQRIIYFTSLHK